MSMTDEQIVKAWGKCIDVTSGCCGDDTTCPYCTDEEEGCAKCFEKLRIDVLALIKRQQAEIESLEADYENVYKQASADILASIADGGTSCEWCIDKHRAEAVREFAEKLKKWKYQSSDWSHGEHPFVVEETDIDELVIEMTEKEGGKG
ncbi:MAG: hypothetical protein UHM23_08870 [Clostridia bacterium]|nr:hypothetical protein [Clostridia bacterium]